jgi:cytochrome P450
MGNRLAEMQLEILWEEIMLRFDKVEIVGEVIQRCRLFRIQKRN